MWEKGLQFAIVKDGGTVAACRSIVIVKVKAGYAVAVMIYG